MHQFSRSQKFIHTLAVLKHRFQELCSFCWWSKKEDKRFVVCLLRKFNKIIDTYLGNKHTRGDGLLFNANTPSLVGIW